MSGTGADEAPSDLRPEPGVARHRTAARRPGRGVLVLAAVAAVVLAATGIASLVGSEGSTSAGPPLTTPTPADRAAASPAPPVVTSPARPADPTVTTGDAGPDPVASAALPSTDPAVPGPAGAVARSDAPAPVSLRVPAIEVDLASLDRLGVADDGTIEVPADPDDAGWLTASAAPGRTGPAVIAGHVDTRDGPAVFARLGELGPGDEVEVGLEDGTTVTYVVTGSETYPKTAFPTDRVYGPAPAPVLRLITCGGEFDRAASSYEDNVVVYAVLAA